MHREAPRGVIDATKNFLSATTMHLGGSTVSGRKNLREITRPATVSPPVIRTIILDTVTAIPDPHIALALKSAPSVPERPVQGHQAVLICADDDDQQLERG